MPKKLISKSFDKRVFYDTTNIHASEMPDYSFLQLKKLLVSVECTLCRVSFVMKLEETITLAQETSSALRICIVNLLELDADTLPVSVTTGVVVGLDSLTQAIALMQRRLDTPKSTRTN